MHIYTHTWFFISNELFPYTYIICSAPSQSIAWNMNQLKPHREPLPSGFFSGRTWPDDMIKLLACVVVYILRLVSVTTSCMCPFLNFLREKKEKMHKLWMISVCSSCTISCEHLLILLCIACSSRTLVLHTYKIQYNMNLFSVCIHTYI